MSFESETIEFSKRLNVSHLPHFWREIQSVFVFIKHNLGGIAQRDKPQESDKSMKERKKNKPTQPEM